MYIPIWILFTIAIWTWLGTYLCRDEAYAAGAERRSPDYRSCWGAASVVMGMFVAACGTILIVAPLLVMLIGGLIGAAHRLI